MHVCVVRGERGGGYNLNFWGGGPVGRAGVPIHCRRTTDDVQVYEFPF